MGRECLSGPERYHSLEVPVVAFLKTHHTLPVETASCCGLSSRQAHVTALLCSSESPDPQGGLQCDAKKVGLKRHPVLTLVLVKLYEDKRKNSKASPAQRSDLVPIKQGLCASAAPQGL